MIKLNVEEYCQDCPDFEAEVEKATVEVHDFDFMSCGIKTVTDTVIKCANCEKCDKIRQYLAKHGILKGNEL